MSHRSIQILQFNLCRFDLSYQNCLLSFERLCGCVCNSGLVALCCSSFLQAQQLRTYPQ